jgi:hypothetical protein
MQLFLQTSNVSLHMHFYMKGPHNMEYGGLLYFLSFLSTLFNIMPCILWFCSLSQIIAHLSEITSHGRHEPTLVAATDRGRQRTKWGLKSLWTPHRGQSEEILYQHCPGYANYSNSFMYRRKDSTVCQATGHELDDQDSISGSNRIFLFDDLSEVVLGPDQSPMQ